MAADGWKWIGSNPSTAVKIDVSQDAAVTSLQINNPSNCVYMDSNKRLNDEDCSTAQYAQICTVDYNAVLGIGASIGMDTVLATEC